MKGPLESAVSRARSWVRQIARVIVTGVLVIVTGVVMGVFMGVVLYTATSLTGPYNYLGKCQPTVAKPGFDPWTGEPYGGILACTHIDGSAMTRRNAAVPDDMVGRRAIPVPAGFALGVAIALIWWGRRAKGRQLG